jgi:hypothetical protein
MILMNLKLHYILAMCPKGGGADLEPNYQKIPKYLYVKLLEF